MLVVGPLFQIAAFHIQFFALPFPVFALSFSLCGIGTVFQVSKIYLYRIIAGNNNNNVPFDSF